MIGPGEIKEKAQKKYTAFLLGYLQGERLFPLAISFGKVGGRARLEGFTRLREELAALREGAKSSKGYGYSVDYREVNDRRLGRQLLPERIYFEGEEDFLKYIGKAREFKAFSTSVALIRKELPSLEEWIPANIKLILTNLSIWPDLIKVLLYFLANPRPNLYIRELPIEVDTKFIESNSKVLRSLLDYLIPQHINIEETHFEKRYNLRYSEPLIRLRVLDRELAAKAFSGLTDLSIPVGEFQRLNLNCNRVLILENKTNFTNIMNFLTIPQLSGTIAIFGKGFAAGMLKGADWIGDKELYYWGDIDLHGLAILARLRESFPGVRSILMDRTTFKQFPEFHVDSPPFIGAKVEGLTAEEAELFSYLRSLPAKSRLEQERIPQSYVGETFLKIFGAKKIR